MKKVTTVTQTVTTQTRTETQSVKQFALSGAMVLDMPLKQAAFVPLCDEDIPQFGWAGRLALSPEGNVVFVPDRRSHGSQALTLMKTPHGALRVLKDGSVRLTLTIQPDADTIETLADVLDDEADEAIDWLCDNPELTLALIHKQVSL